MKTFLLVVISLFILHFSYGQTTYAVVDDGDDGLCASAWPSEILGNYTENGTSNGKPCYQGPNSYWLYNVYMPVIGSNCWVVGYPLGESDVNAANVRFYISSSASTPPTNVRYTKSPNGCGYMKVTSGTASPPPATTLTSAANVGTSSMDLYWLQSSGATGYHVYVSTNSSFTALVSGLAPKDVPKAVSDPYPPTTTSISGLTAGTLYYIMVRAYNGGGESSNSNSLSVTTIPPAPVATAASSIAVTTAQANWNTTSGSTSYKLYVSTNSGFTTYVSGYNGLSIAAQTSYNLTGLSATTTYYYRLKASNSSGDSGYSNTITFTTIADATPPVVSGITLSGSPAANATSVTFAVAFDENANNISTDDFQVTTVSGTATGSVSSVSASSGTSVNVTVNTITGTGTIRLALKSNTNITDNIGNGNGTNGYVAAYTSGSTHTVDTEGPTVSSVTVPANGTYIAAQNLDFTINFNENVIVNTTGGTPQLSLTVGITVEQAGYLSGSGSSALVFRYIVKPNDLDTDGIAVGTLSTNSGTLKDGTGNNATLALNSVGSTTGVLVDAVPPTVSGAPSSVTVTEDVASDADLSSTTFADASGDALTVSLAASAGKFTASSGGGVTVGGSGSGTLTLSGTAANINTYLDTPSNIKYTSALNANGTAAATITITPNDGHQNGTAATVNIDITAVNDDPSASDVPSVLTVTEDTSSGLDLSGISFSDPDIGSGNATLTLSVDAGYFAISNPALNSLTGTGNGTGTISLTGTFTNLEAYLNTPTNTSYYSAPNAYGTAAASLTIKINDNGNTGSGGGSDVTLGTVQINIAAVNDPPVVTASSNVSTFTQGGSAVPVDNGITVSDVDNTTLPSATYSITGNFQSGNDVLAFTNTTGMGNIAASYNASTGVLTLTSSGATATIAEWQAALRAITYSNNSSTPKATGNDRTISLVVNDGTDNSSTVTKTINIIALNQNPSASGIPVSISQTEDVQSVAGFSTIIVSDPDADGGVVTIKFSAESGTMVYALGIGITETGIASKNVTFTGTLTDLNFFLSIATNILYTPAQNVNGTGADHITVTLNDNGNSGIGGGTDVVVGVIPINIAPVNDAPVNSLPASQNAVTGVPVVLSSANGNQFSISDIDAGTGIMQMILTCTHGTVTLSGTTGLSFGAGTGTNDATVTFSGTMTAINNALNGMTFTSAADYQGDASLQITTNDNGNSGAGGALSDNDILTIHVTLPVMDISANSTTIINGDITPSVIDWTDYGRVSTSGTPKSFLYTIENSGTGNLDLTGTPNIEISGSHASDFSVTIDPSSPIAATGTTNFQITFEPSIIGLRTATVSITSNDPVNSPYMFTILGTGITQPTVTTSAASAIGTISALLGGNVTDNGSDAVTERGIVYSDTNTNPMSGDLGITQVAIGNGTGSFSQTIGGLTDGVIYYARAYAKNAAGTGYGDVISFTTLKQLTITNPVISQKSYDGNVDARISLLGTLSGVFSGDDITVSTQAVFDTKDAGTGKTVTVSYTLVGTDKYKYKAPSTSYVYTGVITKAILTVTADEQTKIYGEANPTLTFQYSEWQNGEDESVLDTKPTVSTTIDTNTSAGAYPEAITVSGGTDNNYEFRYVPATFTIERASQAITFEEIPVKHLESDDDFTLTATTSSGLPVSYSYTYSASSAPATVNTEGEVNLLTSGEVEITASQDGNENFLAAEPVTQLLTIESSDATIHEITISGTTYTNPEQEIYFQIDCGDQSQSVNVSYVTEANAGSSEAPDFVIVTTYPGTYQKTITIMSQDGSQTQTFTITIEKRFASADIIVKKFDNVLFVNNNPDTNGGYKFTSYEWYKNGSPIGTGQYYSAGESTSNKLDPNAIYSVEMTDASGKVYKTCDFNMTFEAIAYNIVVSPNPVVTGNTIVVNTTYSPEMLNDMKVTVSTLYGAPVLQKTSRTNDNRIILPSSLTSGTYVVTTTAGGVVLSAKIIIK